MPVGNNAEMRVWEPAGQPDIVTWAHTEPLSEVGVRVVKDVRMYMRKSLVQEGEITYGDLIETRGSKVNNMLEMH